MKLTVRQKGFVRYGLWVASLAWGVLFVTYALILMPALMEILEFYYEGGLPMWAFGIFYVVSAVVAVTLFFWFFAQLMNRNRK